MLTAVRLGNCNSELKGQLNNHILMKRAILVSSLTFFSISAFTQTLVKEMDDAYTRFIPGQYMMNGEAAIYFSEDEYNYSDSSEKGQAEIFDFELNPLKTFSFGYLHPYRVFEARQSTGKKELKKTILREDGIYDYGIPSTADMKARKEAFIQNFFEYQHVIDPTLTLDYLQANCRTEDKDIFIKLPINSDFPYPYQEYLNSVEYYLHADNRFGYAYNYSMTVGIYDGEWTRNTFYDVPVRNLCIPRCYDVVALNHWNAGLYLPFSQTFFNNDAKFEYVRLKAEISEGGSFGPATSVVPGYEDPKESLFGVTDSDRDGDGEVDYKVKTFGLHISGIEVVSDDGSVIYTLPLAADCDGTPSVAIYKSDNHLLAEISYNWYDNGDYKRTVRFYRIDKNSGIVKVVREENHLAATPNPISSGIPVRMQLPEGNYTNRSVSVTDLNGRVVFARNVEPGISEIMVPTHNLSSGMYLFTLVDNGKIVESCKIIVK